MSVWIVYVTKAMLCPLFSSTSFLNYSVSISALSCLKYAFLAGDEWRLPNVPTGVHGEGTGNTCSHVPHCLFQPKKQETCSKQTKGNVLQLSCRQPLDFLFLKCCEWLKLETDWGLERGSKWRLRPSPPLTLVVEISGPQTAAGLETNPE